MLGSQAGSLKTAGAGLAIVVGLFLVCMWLLRRSGPKPTGVLPTEAFAVLGRAPLVAQSFAQLLRLGNKLVLVAVSADGAQPLAEVTDPAWKSTASPGCASADAGRTRRRRSSSRCSRNCRASRRAGSSAARARRLDRRSVKTCMNRRDERTTPSAAASPARGDRVCRRRAGRGARANGVDGQSLCRCRRACGGPQQWTSPEGSARRCR